MAPDGRSGSLRLVGNAEILKVSATDVQDRPGGCGMYGALKIRPRLKNAYWRKNYSNQPFLLKVIREISCRIHDDPRIDTWEGLEELLIHKLSGYDLHPGASRYARHAIEMYLEAHEALELEAQGMRLRTFDPEVRTSEKNSLTAWGMLYENKEAVREIRRLRLTHAHTFSRDNARWVSVAAHVASLLQPVDAATRIRVVEIGLLDGSTETVFDGSPSSAQSLFSETALADLERLARARHKYPGNVCGQCKIAGNCESLHRLDGFLGQKGTGVETRSVSASDIETYERCPAQWFLAMSSNLPKENSNTVTSERGRLVHHWIATAHARSHRCELSDVGEFEDPRSFTSTLSKEEYASVQRFLNSHVANCPMENGAQVISIEAPVYGYDESADLVIASQPDMIYLDHDGTLVVRETKTTYELPDDSGEAFDKYFAVAWLLNLFGSGYKGPYNSESIRFELEVISEEESKVFRWDIADRGVLRMANAEVRHRATAWHLDDVWAASPGRHCRWCPVRRWCPDAEQPDDEPEPSLNYEPGAPGMPSTD